MFINNNRNTQKMKKAHKNHNIHKYKMMKSQNNMFVHFDCHI